MIRNPTHWFQHKKVLSLIMRLIFVGIIGAELCSCWGFRQKSIMNLQKNPPYVVINDEAQSCARRSVLTTPAAEVSFPLSDEDAEIVKILEEKFDNEVNCAGLAAPQIGFAKKIIVFSVPEKPELKRWRADFSQTMPKTIFINPRYKPIGEERHEDVEACFSVDDLAGFVQRFKEIEYSAQLPDGTTVTGRAEGYLARVIQHEVDHVRGILYTSYVDEERLFSLTEYLKLRQQKIDDKK